MRVAVAAAGLLLAFRALACGYCVEDKIASTYDHAVVVGALERKHHIAFFHIDGSLPAGADARRTLERLAESAAGVDKASARVSVDTATLSFAFDPRRTSLDAAHKAVERKLAPRGLSLMPLRVMERAADLKTVAR
jgi:hypothetical protein